MQPIRGSCCCGSVKFILTETPSMMGTCHCSRCRKVGSSVMVFVKKSGFEWVSGKELVATYEPEEGYQCKRNFCGRCGTALGELLSELDSFPVVAHCLDDDPGVRNRFHEFVKDKPAWYDISDDAKQFTAHPVQSA